MTTPNAAKASSSSNTSQAYVQGLLSRKKVSGEPQTAAHYFNHVADAVKSNQELNSFREYNLKRRAQVLYEGYEAVLSKKKRQTTTSRQTFAPAYPTPQRPAVAKSPKPTPPVSIAPQNGSASQQLKRSDIKVGSTVVIKNSSELISYGSRNLVGKTGRVVALAPVYNQDLYSIFIDQLQAIYQVPFTAISLLPTATPASLSVSDQAKKAAIPGVVPGAKGTTAAQSNGSEPRPIDQIKNEHSYQLQRLMQQQYSEIQVLQQQYADNRINNPSALDGIQKELSKLRLVHLSQVQTLKSKQALDLTGRQ